MQGYCTNTEYTGSLGYNSVCYITSRIRWVLKKKKKKKIRTDVPGIRLWGKKRLGGWDQRLQSFHVVSHIQRIGPWSAEQGKKKKKKSLAAPLPPPARCSSGEKKKKKKKSRDASTYLGATQVGVGLGPSRIRTRIPTTRQLGQWVSLRKTLRVRDTRLAL